MKALSYSKNMFVADLVLVSIWALFFSRYHSAWLLLLIPIRIALCFEMKIKSPWTLVSATAFFFAYFFVDNFDKPFERMFFCFFCAIGESELMVEIFSRPLEWEMKAWIESFSALWFIWLIVLPIMVGIRQRRVKEIEWKKKGIWLYLIPATLLCVWIMIDEGSVGSILLGLFIALLPLVYWTLYERMGRSLIQIIIGDRLITRYLGFATFMLLVVTIGLKDISSLKLIGLLTLLPVFYMMLTTAMGLGTVLTRCCVALSVAGLLYWLSLDVERTLTITMLAIAVALVVFVGVTMAVRTHKWVVSVAMTFAVSAIIAPCILGLNPYVVTDADRTRLYLTNRSVRHGVYVVEKCVEKHEKGNPLRYVRVYGLRDRYGLVLPMKYEELKSIDRSGRYIAVNTPVRYGCLISDPRYGVFDLKTRRLILNPEDVEIYQMEKIDDKTFKLVNPEERYFATLYMPGEYRGVYFPDAHVEPHFSDGETSVGDFLCSAQNPDLDIDNQYWKMMRRENPHAYRLLVMMSELSGEEGSPANDLNYAKAIREIIDKDSCYRGNLSKALDDVANLSETMTYSGSQSDINRWTDYLRLIASVRTSLAYESLMADVPDNESIGMEYVAWHNLIEVMAYYLDHLYSSESYRAVTEEKNTTIIRWLDQRRESLYKERDILLENIVYSVDRVKADSIRSDSDYRDFFLNFHSYADPYYYNPMWNEIRVAFDEWRFAREKVAERLDPHKSLSYREYTKEVVDSAFSCIEKLDWPTFRPVLY